MTYRNGGAQKIGFGSSFRRPDFIAQEEPDLELERLKRKFSSDCTWSGCHHPRFYDMPVCQGHAIIIYGRILKANERPADKPRAPEHSPEPFVYYLMLSPTTVKIGTTIDLKRRVSTLYAEIWDVVALERGGWELEQQRHRQFAAERIRPREIFELSDRLKKHIEELAPQRDELVAIAKNDPGAHLLARGRRNGRRHIPRPSPTRG